MKRSTPFVYLLISSLLLLTACSLPYRLTHGDMRSQDEAWRVYQSLSSEEQAEIQKELINIAKNAGDKDVRKAAIAKLTDQEVLAEVAKNDNEDLSRWTVRRAAVEKLADQEVLADVAKNDIVWNVREAALAKLTDQGVLADVAKNGDCWEVRQAAVAKLIDQGVLADVAKNGRVSDVREAAVAKLTDQEVLAEVAKNDNSSGVREAAVKKLTNQGVLADVAKNDKNSDVRQAAVKKLTNQEVLADVAKNDSDWDVRYAAVIKLTDQGALADVAKNDKILDVRKAAVAKLTDQGGLAEVAKNDNDSDIRLAAVEKLTDLEELADVAKNAGYWDALRAARKQFDALISWTIKNPAASQKNLTYIAKNDSDSDGWMIRLTICEAALAKLTDQGCLADVAKNGRVPDVNKAAVAKLTNLEVLVDVAKYAWNSDVRTFAVAKLTDQEALADVAKNGRLSDVREAAVAKLTDQEVLAGVAKSFNRDISKAAVAKLTNQEVLVDVAKYAWNSDVRTFAVAKLTDQEVLADIGKNDNSSDVRALALNRLTWLRPQMPLMPVNEIAFQKPFTTTFGDIPEGDYKLIQNITLDSNVRVPPGATVRLNLWNYRIKGADIIISEGAQLELYGGVIETSQEHDNLNSSFTRTLNQIRNHGYLVLDRIELGAAIYNKGNGILHLVNTNYVLVGGQLSPFENTGIDIADGKLIGHVVRNGKVIPHSGDPVIFKTTNSSVGTVLVEGCLPGKFVARLPRGLFAEERPSRIKGLVDLVVVRE